jgi:hypothetical protein
MKSGTARNGTSCVAHCVQWCNSGLVQHSTSVILAQWVILGLIYVKCVLLCKLTRRRPHTGGFRAESSRSPESDLN